MPIALLLVGVLGADFPLADDAEWTIDDPLADTGAGDATAYSAEPRVLYLFYADGGKPPSESICKGKTPPKFECKFGSDAADCQRKVQAYLDKWYGDFNLVFTLDKPSSGAYYTEVITSASGAWCGRNPMEGGVSPIKAPDCGDYNGNTCYAFNCSMTAKDCAIIVAQEHAHLVGLQHTMSEKDVMNPYVCLDCDGFEDKTQTAIKFGGSCPTMQNSYQLMKTRLGSWSGGAKPKLFPDDAGADAGGGGGAGGSDAGSSDGGGKDAAGDTSGDGGGAGGGASEGGGKDGVAQMDGAKDGNGASDAGADNGKGGAGGSGCAIGGADARVFGIGLALCGLLLRRRRK